MNIRVFIRNDDVRAQLDAALIRLTEAVAGQGWSITHAVEPGNVSNEVADWLRGAQDRYPGRVEIIQHGYRHRICTAPPVRGEFGGGRSYDEQWADIQAGKRRMDELFGERWTRAFSFPYGAYDENTLRALETSGYLIMSTGFSWSLKRRLLNAAGAALQLKRVGRRMISYTGRKYPGSVMYEFAVMINNTRQQTGPDTGIQRSADELWGCWSRIPVRVGIRGVLCHHRYNREADIEELAAFLQRLRTVGVRGVRLQDLYETVAGLRRS